MTTTKGNAYGIDAEGDAVLWSSRGQQVMMAWEKEYMEACVDALEITPMDRVLEIGFGLAYSATRIQHHRPALHTIIECDDTVLERARSFARKQTGGRVVIVAGTWQEVLPTLGDFDCVFFDDYPLPEIDETPGDAAQFRDRRSRWDTFLDVALQHVAPGARITGYLARELDLRRAGCDVHLTPMHVKVASTCSYYPHATAFIPQILVRDPFALDTRRRRPVPRASDCRRCARPCSSRTSIRPTRVKSMRGHQQRSPTQTMMAPDKPSFNTSGRGGGGTC